jgi:hypothetical protein
VRDCAGWHVSSRSSDIVDGCRQLQQEPEKNEQHREARERDKKLCAGLLARRIREHEYDRGPEHVETKPSDTDSE